MTCDAIPPFLDRYLDGELPKADRVRLEEHLRSCPTCAVEALRRRELQAAIRGAGRAFEPSAALKARLEACLRQDTERQAPRASRSWLLPLAAVLLVGVALTAVWGGFRAVRSGRVIGQVVDLHVGALGEATPLDVLSTDAHTVKPWFEGKLPFAFDLPEFSGTGWELAGGRLVRVDGTPAAQLILKIRRHRVSVIVFSDSTGLGLSKLDDREVSRGFRLLSWTASGLRYVAVSDTGAEDLRTLAELFLRAART